MRLRCRIHPGIVCPMLFTVMLAAGPDSPALDEVAVLTESESPDRAFAIPEPAVPASEMRAKVAWTLLASGSDRAALRQFARLAGRQPDDLMPKIGYSLSAAGMGDLSNAARAMRRVLRMDSDALREVELEHRLRLRLETMRTDYLRRLARFDHDRDGAIMLATMCYLLREDETARHAIRYLRAARANGPETSNIERLVLELTQPVVVEVAQAEEPQAADEMDEPLDFTLVFEREAPSPAAPPQPAESAPAIEPQQTMFQEPDVLDEPLDFTLVFQSVEPLPQETLDTPVVTGSAVPAMIDAPAPPRTDPWAPVEATTIQAAATPEPVTVLAAAPVAASDTAAPAAQVTAQATAQATGTKQREQVHIDYDKLRDDLGAVGGALDSFTDKLIRIIAARQKTEQ